MSQSARPSGLMSLEDALARLLGAARRRCLARATATLEADGRVLAQDIRSSLDVPGFDNSSMDGYAVSSAEVAAAVASGQALAVSQRIPATFRPGAAARQRGAHLHRRASARQGRCCS